MASITCKGIGKVYPGGFRAVDDFNLEIADKEFVVLVGPSGCGKSTTLRMIAGLESITEGELYIGDTQVNNVAPKDRDIAMVFQSYALYPDKTVYRNMAFGLERHGVPKAEIRERVNEAAQILDISHLLDRKPKALSGGQRQRVALGRAIVRSPKVFLLDEPLSNLDAKLRTAMRTEITKLHMRLGSTFVYVTHDQTEAMTMGDRIVVMKDGIVQQVDTPEKLYSQPCNTFVAGFIGSPQMNFINVTLQQNGDTVAATFGENTLKLPNDRCGAWDSDSAVLGIRPENITDDKTYISAHPGRQFEALVEVAEHMGSEMYLYLDCNGEKLTARVSPSTAARAGAVCTFAAETENAHVFSAETGEAFRRTAD